MFSQAFGLAKKELKYQLVAILGTAITTVIFGLMTTLLLTIVVVESDTAVINSFILDLIFIGVAPAYAAVFMARPYLSFKAAKDDPYNKRMAFLRALPIPVSVLALSRTIVMLVTLVIMSACFMLAITLALPDSFFDIIPISQMLTFIVIWFGFVLALGGMNPYIEYGTSGKALHIVPHFFVGLFIITFIIFYNATGNGIVEMILTSIKEIDFPVAILSILIGIVASYLWNKLLVRRLQIRDFL